MYGHPLEKEFAQFVSDYKRSYGTDAEFKFRRERFAESWKEIEEFNKQGHKSTIGINQYADWTEEERTKLFGYTPDEDRVKNYKEVNEGMNAAPIDWRQYGAVTHVKDQG